MIEVFVTSHSQYMDVSFYREMSYHIDCGLAKWASETLSKFKGRILPEEDLRALEHTIQIAKKNDEQLKVYDVSRMTDKVRAMKRGIRKTPAAIINGKKYEGLEEILQAVSSNTVQS